MIYSFFQSSVLRYGLLTTIYFLPALFFEYLSAGQASAIRVAPPVILYFLVYVHQLVLSSPAVPYRLPYLTDFTLTFGEVAAYALFVFRALEKCQACGPYQAYLSLAVFNATLLGVLVLILLLKIMDIIKPGRPTLHRRLDFLTAREWTHEAREKARQTFNPRIMFIPLLSRILVVAIVYFTVGLAWRMIILSPLDETNSIPLREYRSPGRAHGPHPDHTGRKVVIAKPPLPGPKDCEWGSAVDVISLSDGSKQRSCSLSPEDNHSPPREDHPPPNGPPHGPPPHGPPPNGPPPNGPPPAMEADAIAYDCPDEGDILVTVNFTVLGMSSTIFDSSKNSVQVMIGGGSPTPDIIRRTDSPVSLIPGWNGVGFARSYMLHKFNNPALSTLGIFMSYKPFIMSDIIDVKPDSLASTSPLITRASDVATIRIIPLRTTADLRIVEEYRDRSVLKGFSAVGGLWTFFSGVFVALFGSSLSMVVFNKKPLSIFGIVHQFQKNTIRQAYSNKYGGIDSDLKKPFPRFMMDNYVDADILKLPEPAVVSRSPNQNRSFFPLTSNVRSEPSHAARSVTSSAQGDSPV